MVVDELVVNLELNIDIYSCLAPQAHPSGERQVLGSAVGTSGGPAYIASEWQTRTFAISLHPSLQQLSRERMRWIL